MNQPDNRAVGVPGGRPGPAWQGPGGSGSGSSESGGPGSGGSGSGGSGSGPRPSPGRPVDEADGLLSGVEDDLQSLDQHNPQDQVAVFDRIHTSLADALARTADTGGQQGA